MGCGRCCVAVHDGEVPDTQLYAEVRVVREVLAAAAVRDRDVAASWVDAHSLAEGIDGLDVVLAFAQDGAPGEREPLVALGLELRGHLPAACLIERPCLRGVLIV